MQKVPNARAAQKVLKDIKEQYKIVPYRVKTSLHILSSQQMKVETITAIKIAAIMKVVDVFVKMALTTGYAIKSITRDTTCIHIQVIVGVNTFSKKL